MYQSDFIINVLRDLQSRTEAAAKRYPGLRHMLVLPPGEWIRIPRPPGSHPVGFSSRGQKLATCKFGETELVGRLPPRTSWPKGVEPLRAVIAEQEFTPYRPNEQEPYRIHLFFGGGDLALNCLQALADDLDGIRDDVERELSTAHLPHFHGVFYVSSDCLHDAGIVRLDSWLCTVHWWAWFWTESPFRTRPQVVYAGRTYETDPRDDAVASKLAFSMFEADVLTASAAMLSRILRFFDEAMQSERSTTANIEAEDALRSRETDSKKSAAKPADWNALSNRQRDCMRALFELRAFNTDSQQRARDVAEKAEGPYANADRFKEPLSDLVRRGLLESKTGREGGYWLTGSGRELLAVKDAQFAPDNPSP